MYPGYTTKTVLEEYAITFYALLAEGYRIRHRHYEMLSIISELPNRDPQVKEEYYRNLKYASIHPGDILKPSGSGSTPAEIKKVLGG